MLFDKKARLFIGDEISILLIEKTLFSQNGCTKTLKLMIFLSYKVNFKCRGK